MIKKYFAVPLCPIFYLILKRNPVMSVQKPKINMIKIFVPNLIFNIWWDSVGHLEEFKQRLLDECIRLKKVCYLILLGFMEQEIIFATKMSRSSYYNYRKQYKWITDVSYRFKLVYKERMTN